MYLLIENFNSGLDSRRMALTSRPGTLQRLENAHITRGGEIEKRKAFDAIASLPNGTFGLHSANGALWVFGSQDGLVPNVYGSAPPGQIPESFYVPRVNYMKLDAGDGYKATFEVSPFCLKFYDRPSGSVRSFLQGVLTASMPSYGEFPTEPYQTFHITFSGGDSPADGLYKVCVVKPDFNGPYRLVIFPPWEGSLDPTIPSKEFVRFTGAVSWTSNQNPNSSTKRTTSSDVKFETLRTCTLSSSIYSADPPIAFTDAYWVSKSPRSILLSQDTKVNPCTVSSTEVLTVLESKRAFSCFFLVGREHDPGDGAVIYVSFNQVGVNSLSYKAYSSERIIFSSFTSFHPSFLGDEYKKYTTAKEWLKYAANELAKKINSGTSVHKLAAVAGDGIVSLSSSDSYYGAANQGIGWWPVVPAVCKVSATIATLDPGANSPIYTKSAWLFGDYQMTAVLSSENFQGKIYAIAQYQNGIIRHFYNGKRVLSWDLISSSSGDAASIASSFASQIKLDGIYDSVSFDNKVYIQFFKKNINYIVVEKSVNGGNSTQGITITTTSATSTSPQSTVLEITGDYEPDDVFTVLIDSVSYTVQAGSSVVGKFCKTHMDKMYSVSGSLLYFSETSTNGGPSAFTNDTNNGSGVVNLSSQDSGSSELTSIALYQGKLAIFSRSCVQIWTMNADPKLNAFSQILNNVGTAAPRSVASLGNIDTYFLSQLGVRSLKARDASNVAIVSDVGNPIDDMILADMSQLSSSKKEAAVGMIDPVDGRYWLSVGPKIYVYSYFPSSNINAWSVYLPTTGPSRIPLEVSHLCTLNDRIYARSGNFIFAYGGLTGSRYDESEVRVQMPYLDGGKPGHFKTLTAVDSACEGEWDIWSGTDIMAPDVFDYIGKIKNSTYSMGRVSAVGIGTHACIKMESKYDGYAKIGNLAVHFEINDAG